MALPLVAAASALALIALVHSVMGEWRIFRSWCRQAPLGVRRPHLVLVRASWHLPSLLGAGQAAALLALGLAPAEALPPGLRTALLVSLAAGTGACGTLVALVTRGRHHGGSALLLTAALILTAL